MKSVVDLGDISRAIRNYAAKTRYKVFGISLLELDEDDAYKLYEAIVFDRKHLWRLQWSGDVTTQKLKDHINTKNNSTDQLYGIHHETHGLMGCIEARDKGPGIKELGYWIGKEYSGKGYVKIAIDTLMSLMNKDTKVIAHIKKDNIPSRKILDYAGFKVVKEDEQWYYFERVI